MVKFEGKQLGIMGTVIIHLIAGIIFMVFQISTLQKSYPKEFQVEIVPVNETKDEGKLLELPATGVEKILKGDEELLNIARNLSSKAEEKINPADYIDKVKEELIKSGKLGINNFIDEKKQKNQLTGTESTPSESNTTSEDEKTKPGASQEMASNYKGPTRIYYDLKGRTHEYLPIPIYKCQGSGRIVLSIEVNRNGVVERATIIENESSTSDPCLAETAVTTALISRFNPDINSPSTETGKLTYVFVAQ